MRKSGAAFQLFRHQLLVPKKGEGQYFNRLLSRWQYFSEIDLRSTFGQAGVPAATSMTGSPCSADIRQGGRLPHPVEEFHAPSALLGTLNSSAAGRRSGVSFLD